MNEEVDESEFYYQDYTTASEWEIFMARIEEVLHEWKIEDADNAWATYGIWKSKTENIPFADVEFSLSIYIHDSVNSEKEISEDEESDAANVNPIENSSDFHLYSKSDKFNHIHLYEWYGLKKFIVLYPLGEKAMISESRIKILLSSINIIAGNCDYPLFIQVRESWQKCYMGVYEGNGIRTNFEMIHLRKGPQHCNYLTGLIDLFKTKIMSHATLDPILVSAKLTYAINEYGNLTWKQDLLEADTDSFDSTSITQLPFGVAMDPVENFQLNAIWSQIPDNLVVDNENYSNYDPMQAPQWTLAVNFTEKPVCFLSDSLTEFLLLTKNNNSIYDVLGDFAAPISNTENSPLDLLTESKVPTISSVLKRAARNSITKTMKRIGTAPLADEILVPMIYFLFPDAEEDSPYTYFKKDLFDEATAKIEEKYRGFKTCRVDSLVWRLSIILCHAVHTLGGQRALSHIWFEFCQEMRYRWEKSIMIPGLSPGFPDARTCLLNQKLQMLNCCIDRKKARESALVDKEFVKFEDANSNSDDDDEFFDCQVEKAEDKKFPPWNQPIGRAGKFEDLKLVKTGEPLYIPITQEAAPKTEDQLEEQTDFLLKLGSDANASELRARMMSASLLSDMESFKAANPGSVLEDFIRWYSPRDWIEEESGELDEWGQRKGRLSSRMLISGNTWVETWELAKAVPAHRQRRLFDDTCEAEKVLHFLESKTLAQIAELILLVLAHVSLYRLIEEHDQLNVKIPKTKESLEQITKVTERITREGKVQCRRYELLQQEFINLELSLARANSLLYKLNPEGSDDEEINRIVEQFVNGHQVEIAKTSKAAKRIVALFSEAQKVANLLIGEQVGLDVVNSAVTTFPPVSEREFAMRVSAHRPAAYSAKCPQFLRAVLSKNEFRLAGAFSEDITFF